jgi:hypothetical protein
MLLQGGADVEYFPLAHKTAIAVRMSGTDYPRAETSRDRDAQAELV